MQFVFWGGPKLASKALRQPKGKGRVAWRYTCGTRTGTLRTMPAGAAKGLFFLVAARQCLSLGPQCDDLLLEMASELEKKDRQLPLAEVWRI